MEQRVHVSIVSVAFAYTFFAVNLGSSQEFYFFNAVLGFKANQNFQNMINSYTDNVVALPAANTEAMSEEQLKAKILANLATMKTLQTDVSRLTTHIVELSWEIEQLSVGTNGGGLQDDDNPDDELDDLLGFDDHHSLDSADQNDRVINEAKRDQLQSVVNSCCELISLKKNEILLLLNAAEADSMQLLKLKQEAQEQQQEQQEEEQETEELIDLKTDFESVADSNNNNLIYDKETLMGLAKVPGSTSPLPIDADIMDKFPELFRKQAQAATHNKLRRKSWRSTNNFC